MHPSEPVTAILPVIEALEQLGVAYYVGGSVASTAHGHLRSTMDADIVADLHASHVDGLVAALRADYYVDAGMIREAIADHACFNVIHLATVFKVDIFANRARAFDREVFARRVKKILDPAVPEVKALLASAEDIVLLKLEWYRLGNEVSDRQWGDIVGVLKVQRPTIDREYLNRWALELGVTDLLQRAWREVEG